MNIIQPLQARLVKDVYTASFQVKVGNAIVAIYSLNEEQIAKDHREELEKTLAAYYKERTSNSHNTPQGP